VACCFIKTKEEVGPDKDRRVHDKICREHENEQKNGQEQEQVEEFKPEDPVRRSDLSEPLHGVFHFSP